MTYPATLASLALWLDGSAPAWSDAGATVLTAAPAGRVRRLDQPAPLSGSWLAASDSARPFRDAAAISCHIGASALCISAPVGATLPGNACTIAASWVPLDTNSPSPYGLLFDTEQVLFMGTDAAGKFGLAIYSNRLVVYYRGTLWDPFSGGSPTTNPGVECSAVLTVAPTGLALKYDFGGVTGSVSLSVSVAASTVTDLQIGTPGIVVGSAQVGRLHASVSQVVGVARVCNGTEITNLLAFCVANQPDSPPTTAPWVGIIGDSIARGVNLYQRDEAWPFLMLPNLYGTAPVRLTDTAISGWTLAQMQADFAGSVQPFYSASRAKNIVVVAGGTNSLYFGASQEDTLAQYFTLCDTARAAGLLVVAQTLLPRDAPGFEAKRQFVNTGIRANPSHYDALADTAAIVGMGGAGDYANTTYYGDGTHPTIAGHVLLEPVYRAAVLELLAAEVVPEEPNVPEHAGLSSVLTYDQAVWHRPGIDELGGGAFENATMPADPRRSPGSKAFNQLTRQIVAQAKLSASVRLQVEFVGGAPQITALAGLASFLEPSDFHITDNGSGDTSLTIDGWIAEWLRPLELTVVGDVEIDRARVFPIAKGWRVKTKLGATGTDAAFVLALHAPAPPAN